MFSKLKSIIDVFRRGAEVTDPEKWKSHQITGTILAAAIISVVNLSAAFGHPLPIDSDSANAIGVGIVALYNVLLTASTSKRAGILPAKVGPNEPSDNNVRENMPNVNISDETRKAAMRAINKADNIYQGGQ